jgi:acyl-CoA thioester hydrolase
VSDFRRVQSNREYDLHRVSDGARILRARTNWVYIDTETKSPKRLPDDFRAAFEPSGEIEALDACVLDPIKVEHAVTHVEERRVQHYELDSAGHVNNAAYVGWIEQAIRNALSAAGWPPARLLTAAFGMSPLGREIEYLRSAVEGDTLRLETRLIEVGHDRAAWRTDIRQAESGELLITDIAVRAFSDVRGSRSIPDDLLLSLVRPAQPRG